jgi:hypothetical protein
VDSSSVAWQYELFLLPDTWLGSEVFFHGDSGMGYGNGFHRVGTAYTIVYNYCGGRIFFVSHGRASILSAPLAAAKK